MHSVKYKRTNKIKFNDIRDVTVEQKEEGVEDANCDGCRKWEVNGQMSARKPSC